MRSSRTSGTNCVAEGEVDVRIASRNFVTYCLINDVTGGFPCSFDLGVHR